MPEHPRFRNFFVTPFEHFADRRGEMFKVIRTIDEPDEGHDEEVLPMYVIEFASDGLEIEAWPEEVTWTDGEWAAIIDKANS